jgi:outer membrane protein assembly factor BamB
MFDYIHPRVEWDFDLDDYQSTSESVALAEDGTVYFSVSSGSSSPDSDINDYIYALNPDGSLKWKLPTPSWEFGPVAVGPDGTIYVGSMDGSLYAITAEGKIKWRTSTSSGGYSSGGCPSIGPDGTIYYHSYGTLYAFDDQGAERWSLAGFSQPVIAKDGTLYSYYSDEDTSYVAFLNPDGSVRWRFAQDREPFWNGGVAIGSDGTLYFGTFAHADTGYFYALGQDSVLAWKYPLLGGFVSEPVIGPDGTIYVCAAEMDYYDWAGPWYSCYLYALSPDGKLRWRYSLADAAYYDFRTPAVGDDGTVYLVTVGYGGGLYAVSKDGVLLWDITVKHYDDAFSGSTPSIGSGGILYIGGHTLNAIRTDSKGLASSPWPKFAGNAHNTGSVNQ